MATAPTPGSTRPVPKLAPAVLEWEGKTYQYDARKITVATATAIKLHTGMGLRSFSKAVDDWDPQAVQALLFAVKAQNGEHVAIGEEFDIVDFMTVFEDAYAKSIEDAVQKLRDESGVDDPDPSEAEAASTD